MISPLNRRCVLHPTNLIATCAALLVTTTLLPAQSTPDQGKPQSPETSSNAPQPADARGYKPYSAIEFTSYVFDEPRPIRAWTARIDLAAPEIVLVFTPPADLPGNLETTSATATEFAQTEDVQLAINATPFRPQRDRSGEGIDLLGLAARDGRIYSEPHPQYGAFVLTTEDDAEIWAAPIAKNQLDHVDGAAGGYHVLVRDGHNRVDRIAHTLPAEFVAPQPRTALGLADDNRTLWVLIVDGRNPGRSEGMSLTELADWAIDLGCASLLNMDGGGSTTLVLQDPASKAWRLINQPIGRGILGTERFVGNHLGVRIRAANSADADPDKP